MSRKNVLRDEQAVSPVIAIILLVAITVVLAATLYVMLGDFGDEELKGELHGDLWIEEREEGSLRLGFISLSPSSLNLQGTTVTLYNDNDETIARLEGEKGDEDFEDFNLRWTRLDGDEDEVRSSSKLWVEYDPDAYDEDDLEDYEIMIRHRDRRGFINEVL